MAEKGLFFGEILLLMQVANTPEQNWESGLVGSGSNEVWFSVAWSPMVGFFMSRLIKIWVQMETFLMLGHSALLYPLYIPWGLVWIEVTL